jgi:hypothetical protein
VHLDSFVRKFAFYILPFLPSFQVLILQCHLVSNHFAWVFRDPPVDVFICRDMFSSPPKPFELHLYASAMADCFAKAESPPPPRVRHFSRGTRNLFLLEANEGEESDRECSPSP